VADDLASRGFPTPTSGNAAPYDGIAKLVAGVAGIDGAHTLLQFAPEESVIVLDRREDATVDLILGADFERLRTEEEVVYDPTAVIEPLDGCLAADKLLKDLPALPPSPSQDADAAAATAAVSDRQRA
jgi:hypothetical protein